VDNRREAMTIRTSLTFLVALFAPAAWTDVLPPPPVAVYFDNLDKFPDYMFFLFPTDNSGAFQKITAREPFTSFVNELPPAKLYAVKGPLPEKPNDRIFSDSTLPRSAYDLRFWSVVASSGAQEFHYRITAIKAGVIKLELVSKHSSPWEYHRVRPPH
jgi:hypothetical protein